MSRERERERLLLSVGSCKRRLVCSSVHYRAVACSQSEKRWEYLAAGGIRTRWYVCGGAVSSGVKGSSTRAAGPQGRRDGPLSFAGVIKINRSLAWITGTSSAGQTSPINIVWTDGGIRCHLSGRSSQGVAGYREADGDKQAGSVLLMKCAGPVFRQNLTFSRKGVGPRHSHTGSHLARVGSTLLCTSPGFFTLWRVMTWYFWPYTRHWGNTLYSPLKSIGTSRPIPLFLQYTEFSWGWDKKMNTRQEFRISALISWYLQINVLNYSFLGEQKYWNGEYLSKLK